MFLPFLAILAACDTRIPLDGAAPAVPDTARPDTGLADTDPDTDTTSPDTDADTDTGSPDLDADGDGYALDDCDDADADVHPGAVEVGWDGIDADCDGTDLHDWHAVVAGGDYSCGIRSTGDAVCWGAGAARVGLDAVEPGPWTSLTIRPDGVCALDPGGVRWCWGDDMSADPGTFASLDGACGVTPTGGVVCDDYHALALAGFRGVTEGAGYVCALGTDGAIACWDGDIGAADHYGQDEPPAGAWAAVDAGGSTTCALDAHGALRCWGQGDDGRASPPAGSYVALSVGTTHACALDGAGAIACWGRDDEGQTEAPAGAFVAVSAGDRTSCAVRADGSAVCWGENREGAGVVP